MNSTGIRAWTTNRVSWIRFNTKTLTYSNALTGSFNIGDLSTNDDLIGLLLTGDAILVGKMDASASRFHHWVDGPSTAADQVRMERIADLQSQTCCHMLHNTQNSSLRVMLKTKKVDWFTWVVAESILLENGVDCSECTVGWVGWGGNDEATTGCSLFMSRPEWKDGFKVRGRGSADQ